MPKTKEKVNKVEPKEIDELEEKEIDPEGILGADILDEDADDEGGLDDEEIDPFKDKWEE